MRRSKSNIGVTLIEFLLVVSVAAILVQMASHQRVYAHMNAKQSQALEHVRRVADANHSYHTRFGKYPRTFDEVLKSGLLGGLDLQDGHRQGRWTAGYSYQYWSNARRYFLRCWPDYVGYSGDSSYYVDESHIVRASSDGLAHSQSSPQR